jgi:hypothetical protein
MHNAGGVPFPVLPRSVLANCTGELISWTEMAAPAKTAATRRRCGAKGSGVEWRTGEHNEEKRGCGGDMRMRGGGDGSGKYAMRLK